MRGKEISLDYESSAAQRSSLKCGAERMCDTSVDTVAVFCVLWEVTGRGQVGVAAVNLLHHRPDSVTAVSPGLIGHFSHAQRPVNKIENTNNLPLLKRHIPHFSTFLQSFSFKRSPPGGLWKFTPGRCLSSANAGPASPSGGSPGYVGSSVGRARGLDPAAPSSRRCLDNRQTSLTTSCHGAHRSDGFDWSPQGQRGLAAAAQPTTSHTLSGRKAHSVVTQNLNQLFPSGLLLIYAHDTYAVGEI